MMASNLLSRLLPSNNMAPSIYEDLRAHDETSEPFDVEERAAMALDEENLGGAFQDYDLEHTDVFNGEDSRVTTKSTTFLPQQQQRQHPRRQARDEYGNSEVTRKSKWVAQSPRILEDDGDDDVPASLLIEGDEEPGPSQPTPHRSPRKTRPAKTPSVPGPSTRETRARWNAAQAQQQLHQEDDLSRQQLSVPKPRLIVGSPRERALWTWINATNMDHFMGEVYEYYRGAGIWCICLDRFLNLLTVVFVATFTTFLTQCIDYKKVAHSKKMSEILIPHCTTQISGFWNAAIWLLTVLIIWRFCALLFDIRRLKTMHDFYLHLLNVPDSDMQTISWQDIVARLMALRDANPLTAEKVTPVLREYMRKYMGSQSKERLDAHDIANRLMRKENYLIALFNKEILDLTLPIPFLRNRQIFSRTIEWNLNLCILDFIFNEQGQVRQLVLKDTHRRQLSEALRRRFLFAGVMNVICAPVIVIYLLIVYFFKYFNEYQKNPSALGSRQYTPLAEWKFREFNELPHLFNERINMSYPFASRYVEQFPKVKMVQIFRFIAFVTSAIVSVLALATVFDPEMFLSFEITPERTVIFYLGVFGSIWAVSHGAIPEENMVFNPEYALRNVIEYTHYMPSQWKDRLHSDEVKREFSELYQMKIVIFLEEVLSIIFTPLVLWFSLPQCSDRIIDFFREFTIHVDGLGYVCSFAVFDFKRGVGSATQQGTGTANDGLRDDYYSTKHGKMAASYYGFLDNYVTNPKTGIPGHIPPGMRPQFYPPPTFPGLMSPTLAADMAASRMGRSERPRSRAPGSAGLPSARTPRFPPSAAHASPMPSMLLDPHHQPSASGFGGGRSTHNRRNSRSRYLLRENIIEDPIEDEEEEEAGDARPRLTRESSGPDSGGLDESKWETSPTRTSFKTAEEGEDSASGNAGGVLGLLYQFHQKAQADGRAPAVHI